MKMNKIFALILAAAMLLGLCGCELPPLENMQGMPSGEMAGEPETAAEQNTETAAEPEAAEAPEAPAVPEEPEEKSLDFDKAYGAYDPETVVFYVEGVGVTWQELFYQIAFHAAYLASQEGKPITDWNDTCSFYLDEQGNPVTYGAVVMQNATGRLIQYHIMNNHFREAGVTLGEEGQAAVDTVRQTTINQSFGGDEAAFQAYLEGLYCTEEIWNWFNEVDALYNYDGFDHFSGEMGSYMSDAEVMDYAAGDENGAWTEYVRLKLICLYEEEPAETEEASGEASDEPSEEPGAETEEESKDAQELLVQILTAEDKEAVFDELYAQYNDEPVMDDYPDGRCVYQGDIHDTVYQMALTMEIGECKLVSLEGTDVIVMKLPLDPDGSVYYDAATDTMHTLRFFAAWQVYAEMTGGKDGWIAAGAANTKWAEGFENFSLDTVF